MNILQPCPVHVQGFDKYGQLSLSTHVVYRMDTESSYKDKKEQMKMMMTSLCLCMWFGTHKSYKKRTCGNHYPDSLISFFDRVTRLIDRGWFWKQRVLIFEKHLTGFSPGPVQIPPFPEAPRAPAMGLSSRYFKCWQSCDLLLCSREASLPFDRVHDSLLD